MDPRIKCHIHIIESPSAEDILNNRSEGILLSQGLRVIGIESKYLVAISRKTFWKALDERIEYDNQTIGPPILHLSAHGNRDGIGLADGSMIPWDELGTHLQPINKKLNEHLMICISSCAGFQGHRMALKMDEKDMPFYGLVGPTTDIAWDEAAIAFLSFYYQFLIKKKGVTNALEIMKLASGNPNFGNIKAVEARDSWYTGMMGIVGAIVRMSQENK